MSNLIFSWSLAFTVFFFSDYRGLAFRESVCVPEFNLFSYSAPLLGLITLTYSLTRSLARLLLRCALQIQIQTCRNLHPYRRTRTQRQRTIHGNIQANIQMRLPIGRFRSSAVLFFREECLYFPRFRFYTYERVQEIVAFIQTKVPTKPQIAIICGSGLGGLAELVSEKVVIPYADIPHFPQSTGNDSGQVSCAAQCVLLIL